MVGSGNLASCPEGHPPEAMVQDKKGASFCGKCKFGPSLREVSIKWSGCAWYCAVCDTSWKKSEDQHHKPGCPMEGV